MDKVWIFQGSLSVKQHSKNCSENVFESTLIIIISWSIRNLWVKIFELQVHIDNFKILLLLL